VGAAHRLDGIGDYFARGEGVFHTGMAHSDAVADSDGVEFKRYATGLSDGLLDNLGNFMEVDVAGDYVTVAVGNTDEGFIDVFIGQTAGTEQSPVRGTLKTFFYGIA
jgi:hypothetical protein